MRSIIALALALVTLSSFAARAQQPAVSYRWFEYIGHDPVFERPLPSGSYRNPILAGFYPDPSITRAGGHYYLVNSTFTYFPGIPVFESADLVHWHQIGNVLDRPSELSFDGLSVSRGLFAPTIQFHRGVYYLLNTAIDAGGNFLSIAYDPAGPWSDPIWLPRLDGIDPSLFFDDDGRAYLLNNGPPPGKPQYEGHRAIWVQQFDLATRRLIGPRKVLVDGGVDIAKKPVWIEGPHLYKRRGWYYLMCAEGGTSTQHSEVVLRSHSPLGPFRPYAGNPILTQRDLPPDRADAIADAGHADLVEAPDGRWWAVFLAVRTYDEVHYNLGRETFLLPVTWKNDWPVLLPHGETIPYVAAAPVNASADAATTAASGESAAPTSGNFSWRDDFNAASLQSAWLQVRIPRVPWLDLQSRPGWLTIHALPAALDTLGNPSFLARRQQHTNFEASTALELPASGGVAAGIAVFQNENYWYFLGARRLGAQLQIFLEKDSGHGAAIVASAASGAPASDVALTRFKVTARARRYSFFYAADDGDWQTLLRDDDGAILSSDVAGGFVGTVLGPYARAE
jgi:alpha-N-arabinofuranosidase